MGKLKYLVIHCTATPEGREVTAADIKRWHTSPVSAGGRGWNQVGYTDLFKLDGTVERLVNNNEDANVDPWEITNGAKGYNSVSRHIVYAGGTDKNGKAKDTRTEAQEKALREYVIDFHRRFPDVKILGHRDLSPDKNGNGIIEPSEWIKACPSFEVSEWLKGIGIRQ
ncbi:MAG: N-acetylmuramoyl-L-alanine amidase [Muribaculaceae bacterium]|nr:N-acetylmuramoyl-L-alanine amidase [Muribaculaceae bacterium]